MTRANRPAIVPPRRAPVKDLHLLKNEQTESAGVAIQRQKCGWNKDYLLEALAP